jgi:hypothetical protein
VAALLAWTLALAMPAVGSASFEITKWEAETCNTDTNTTPPDPVAQCSYASPESRFFTQVGGRANFDVNHFAFPAQPFPDHPQFVIGEAIPKDVRVDLPPGLTINPQAAPHCTEAILEQPPILGSNKDPGTEECERLGSRVGTIFLDVAGVRGVQFRALLSLPVFNIVPKPGEPAELGFTVGVLKLAGVTGTIFLEANVAWASDYHSGVTIHVPEVFAEQRLGVVEAHLSLDKSLGGNSLISLGTDCHASTTSTLTTDTYEHPIAFLSKATAPIGPDHVLQPTGCDQVPFEPTLAAHSASTAVDSPTALSVSVGVPFEPEAPIAQAHLKRAVVTLPKGMGLNPAAAGRLGACADAQFPRHIAIGNPIADPAGVHPPPISCPPASAIGTVAIDTPLLPPDALKGTVYLAQQLSRDPASGNQYRVFLDASSARFGVYVRLVGQIAADPATGQLTATFDEPERGGLPQVPFRSLDLHLDGAGGPLTTPPTCGAHALTAKLFPWTGAAAAAPTGSFALSSAPGSGACPRTLAERPFAPAFGAAVDNPRVGVFSPLRIRIERPDGQQELKGADFTLPAGESARLAGIPYCPEAAIAAAARASGTAERDRPSCPAASRIGSVAIAAGTGPSPTRIPGSVYLAGPYRGAPLSLAAIVPALAGPFDLGTSVVRAALFLDPQSARIHAVSDPIPDVFGGAKLDVRSLSIDLDRPEFALDGTGCSAATTTGALRGGGPNPADPASFSSFPVSSAQPLSGCKALGFKPKLRLALRGATKRAKHPELRVSLAARPGDANLASASVALPHALILDQRSLAAVCTRPQFAAEQCPAKSVYGTATASSPLLDKPLEGNVYLRSSDGKLPDLVAHLKGQITVDLDGRIDTFKGGIRTTFKSLPDVPISSFSLTIPGGRHGLLQASANLCKAPVKAVVALAAQNAKKLGGRQKLKVPCHRR